MMALESELELQLGAQLLQFNFAADLCKFSSSSSLNNKDQDSKSIKGRARGAIDNLTIVSWFDFGVPWGRCHSRRSFIFAWRRCCCSCIMIRFSVS